MPQSAWLGVIYEQFRRELFITAWTVLRRRIWRKTPYIRRLPGWFDCGHLRQILKLYVFRSLSVMPRSTLPRPVRGGGRGAVASRFGPAVAPQENPADELLRLVADAVRRLDDSSREVIELHLQAALTFQEIAEMRENPCRR